MANDVTFQRAEYDAAAPAWSLVADVVAGERAIKAGGTTYLPQPNPSDTSTENVERYAQYLARAVFYGATGRTLRGLVGAAFRKVPTLAIPGSLDYIADDIDGAGVSVYQQSQGVLSRVLQKGRHALLADYPQVAAPASRADMASGRVRATLVSINAEQVINWRTEKRGAAHLLTLVVIAETREVVSEDGFGSETEPQFRVLRLGEKGYTQEIWRAAGKGWELADGPIVVTDGSGRPWDVIPFAFVGAENNDAGVDASPLYDLATLNVAHYRNSADYEDSVYLVGQPQYAIAGLSEEWRDWMQEQGIYLGARAPLLLPQGGGLTIAQAQPNSLAKEAMDQKEAQMAALGARLLQPGSAVKTATEAQGEQEAEHSVLSLAASNVSEAYSLALGWMARFMGAEGGEIDYAINQEFTKLVLDPDMLTALIGAWQSGQIPEADLWQQLRKYGVIAEDKDDETIRGELETQNPGLGLTDDGADG